MKHSNGIYRELISLGLTALFFGLSSISAFAQDKPLDLDSRLIEVVERVKIISQSESGPPFIKSTDSVPRDASTQKQLSALMAIRTGVVKRNTDAIRLAIDDLEQSSKGDIGISLDGITTLYREHARLLEVNADRQSYFENVDNALESGNWFEKFSALTLAEILYSETGERNAALQKAQLAFSLIPQGENSSSYSTYAMAEITNRLSKLYNIQGNVNLALDASLAYLSLDEAKRDPETAVDIVNNLIFSHSLKRDHKSLVYLSEAILEIEKTSPSSLPGLSELRISQAMNASTEFEKALKYADLSLSKLQINELIKQAKINLAIALAGLGQTAEAKKFAIDNGVKLESGHLLNEETRRDALYLGFLLAKAEDPKLATALYNRQLDVTAQKFLANNSRDTTAMLADLENSRERQAERAAAAAREARLQAITLDRQRKLNKALMVLTGFISLVAMASIFVMKVRGKLLKQLKIKTKEAASAEKLKTEFLGMISHELRTPLNGIIGISDFLANYHEDPAIRKKTSIILDSGNELLSVIESLTDMARLDAGQLELAPHEADLSKSLTHLPENWTEMAEEKGLTFTHFVDPKIGTHHIDEDRLIQCLNIVLENAIRFTDAGRVHMHITANMNDSEEITGLTAIIADTGHGMSVHVQSRLFTPFMQADTSRKRTHMGTGLSLAIAHALIEMMGGTVSLVSREGRGSEFKFDIPLGLASGDQLPRLMVSADEKDSEKVEPGPMLDGADLSVPESLQRQIEEAPVLDRSESPQREFVDLMQPNSKFRTLHDSKADGLKELTAGRQRILIIDDIDSNRDTLRMILEKQGHDCRVASDGLTGLAMLDHLRFDVVILDIHMTPLDGVEMLQRLRRSNKSYADIPVIALTADNAASTNAACMKAGADLFLTKPVQKEELYKAITYIQMAEGARILSQV